jgi:uncharacterized protein (TIGR02611 family)
MFVDADEDRWAWRAKIKRNPTSRRIYRAAVAVIGLSVMAVGFAAIPLPGPGWAIVFVGLAILASEFDRAQAVLEFGRRHVLRWTEWISAQALWVRLLAALLTLLTVLAVFWLTLKVAGVPGWFPGFAEDWLHRVPGL